MSTEEGIVRSIWEQSEGDYVFLPYMQHGTWTEGDAVRKDEWQPDHPGVYTQRDQYFTPLTYTGLSRRKGMLGKPGVIYADLDGGHIEVPRLHPTLIVSTSNGHYHAYWYLTEPAEPAEWERRAKGWSLEIGADPGGWDATQVLRIPGSYNHKSVPPLSVYVQNFDPIRKYDLEEFPRAAVHTGSVLSPEPVPSKAEREYLLKAGVEDDRLPLSARYWLTASPAQIKALGKIDRSKVMWQVEKALLQKGYTPYEVYHLMYFSGINKFYGRPDRLWHEVQKAAGTS